MTNPLFISTILVIAVVALLMWKPRIKFDRVTHFSRSNIMVHCEHCPDKAIPLPLIIHCPECGARHVDVGEFATKPHRDHSCQKCGLVWRPAKVPTVGVQFLPGYKN